MPLARTATARQVLWSIPTVRACRHSPALGANCALQRLAKAQAFAISQPEESGAGSQQSISEAFMPAVANVAAVARRGDAVVPASRPTTAIAARRRKIARK